MARPDSNQTWGTWEELLLACAVHRHGTHSWDSVAAELRKCTSSSLRLATPLACQHKFQELQHRFSKCGAVLDSAVPWLEELRKLRVAELRRDVQRFDLSIVSLQLKVRRLTEEREQSINNATEILELEKKVEFGVGERKKNGVDEEKQPLTGEESDKENRSINESNSTDPKDDGGDNQPEKVKMESVRSEAETKRGAGEEKGAAEDSCDGSCHSVAEQTAEKLEGVESGESMMGESKGEGSSDIQSWAGRSKQEDESGSPKRVSLQSQPLVDILEKLRSHKQLCVFERPLKSQEMPDYLNLIRQHLDLGTLQSRVEEGFYSDCTTKFFRDLLLLLNNALVYFGPKSKEYRAALELRKLVSEDQAAFQARASRHDQLLPPKPDPEPSHLLTIDTKLSLPSTACRKRSSLAGKAHRASAPSHKKSPQLVVDEIEKPIVDLKQQDGSESGELEVRDEKCTSPAPRIMKTKKDAKSESCVNPVTKNENNPDKVTNSKKRNAANFLNRIKRGSPPDKVSVSEETLKVVAKSAKSEEKGSRNVVQKEGNLEMQVGGRRAKEKGISGNKRSASAAAAAGEAPDQPGVVGGKRRRGASTEAEACSFGQATKRSRE